MATGIVARPRAQASRRQIARWRGPLLWLAGVRVVLSIVAIPMAPFLYREHFAVLVLMRPTKEVLLAGGFLVKSGDIGLPVLLVAAVPLMLFGVWHFYWLGLAYASEIARGSVPRPADRVLPPERIRKMQKVLRRKGTKVAFLGRLAAFPSTLVAAAAGSAKMPSRDFLKADGLGALASIVEVVGAGYLLGDAYDAAGPWLTVSGLVALAALWLLIGRWLKQAG